MKWFFTRNITEYGAQAIHLHKSTADMQAPDTRRKALLFFYSDPASEIIFKGTVTYTLKKMLLSTEQQEEPTYTCIL